MRRIDERNVVARVGNDELAVIVLEGGADAPPLLEIVKAYEAIFHHPFYTGDRDGKDFLTVTASLGAVTLDSDDPSFDVLLARAEVALDDAKRQGGNTAVLFGPELEVLFVERSLERNELLAALDGDTLFLEYQPTFNLVTHAICGAEALIRWQHPTRGIVRPDALLPAIRRANLLSELTSWVMRRIARDLRFVDLPRGFRCYFNVPAQVLENNSFVNHLQQILLADVNLSEHLGIEITESELMHNVERAISALDAVRKMGIVAAVDDFGTGYSSLNYLKRLPLDVLKLDKAFIDGLPTNVKDIALAELFLSIGAQFGLVTVGEGIEDERQAEWLSSHGCMIGQGFWFSRPVRFDVLLALIARETPVLAP